MTNTIVFAKEYARRGWQSFPLRSHEKTPVVRWADVATTEENMLVGWWDTNPDANIGIACGKRSGIVVLDVDADHGGYESMEALIEQHGKLPETPIARTGGGGEHIFFAHPGVEIRNSAGRLGPGLDIRGDGGYVVAAPSTHPNGKVYEWIVDPSTPLAPFPAWMIEYLKDTPATALPVSSNGAIANGSRNATLTSLAGTMRNKGFSEDAMYQALLIHNREKCSPPLTDGEILVIARSVSRYVPKNEPKEIPHDRTSLDVMEEIEVEIREREKNPVDVWGIHYAWPYISLLTGGKQRGELIILAGEPEVGKSWWAHQDALFTAIGNPQCSIPEIPVGVWSGEMKKRQVFRRMIDMLGVPKRHMLSGNMSGLDWENFNRAKAIISNSPIFVYDHPLSVGDMDEFLRREIDQHGLEQFIIDYDWLIAAPGENEIQTSQTISRACKNLAHKFDISIVLVSSVNKMGMDTLSQNVSKSYVSGSGKKLHDADVIYIMTKFNPKKNDDLKIMPCDYDKISTLHISKGRDLDMHAPGGFINYKREQNSPKFYEMKDPATRPNWIEPDTRRKDIFGE
jgi:hypothetical protein